MQAYTIEVIVPHVDVKITAACVHGPADVKTVILGTDEGKLMTYNVQWSPQHRKFASNLEHIKSAGHGKKPVTNLTLFGDVGLLFTLCDGYLDVWNPLSLEAGPTLPQNKGVSAFCVYGGPDPNFEIAVAQKKRLLLFEYTGKFTLLKEFTFPEPIIDLLWWHDTVFAAWKNQYVAIDVISGSFVVIGSYETEPLLRIVCRKYLVQRAEKRGSIFDISAALFQDPKLNDPPGPVATIQWSSIPRDVCTQFPYLISAQSQEIEIHSMLSWHLQQTISSSHGFRFIAVGSADWILAVSKQAICALALVPFPSQAEQLVRAGRTDDGIALLKATCAGRKDFDQLMTSLLILAGVKHLSKLDFSRAFAFFARGNYSPHQILVDHFPYLLPSAPAGPEHETHIKRLIETAKTLRSEPAAEADAATLLRQAETTALEYFEGARKRISNSDLDSLRELCVALFKLHARLPSKTKLMQTFLESAPEDALPFPILEQYCVSENFWFALGCLYKKFRFPRKALDIWKKLGLAEIKDPASDGIHESAQLLSETTDIELIAEFSAWIHKKDRTKFMSIFTSSCRSEPLPFSQVIAFLTQFGRSSQESYLEWLVLDRKQADEKVESALAWHYLETVLGLIQPKDASNFAMITSSAIITNARMKLSSFLSSHSLYNPHPILARIQLLPLWNEKIILHQRLGQHEKALQIIFFELNSIDRAEEYCLTHGSPTATDPPHSLPSDPAHGNPLLLVLLKLILEAHPGEPLPQTALALLSKHPHKFNAALVLQQLGPDVPLTLLQPFLQIAVRHSTNTARMSSVNKNLEKTFNLSMKAQLYKRTTRSILITQDVLCPLCKKPIADKVFAFYPNGCVIHYKCFQSLPSEDSKHTCPVSQRNFLYDPL